MTQVASSVRRARGVSLDLDSPELAATYDKVTVRQFNHGKVLVSSLRVKPGERVLDIGCGTGRLGEYVAGLVAPEGEVVGVDPLPLRSELAARKSGRFELQIGHPEDLSTLKDARFDVAYLNGVLHWVQDKPRALREACRVLKRGGRVGVNSADADRSHQGAALVREAVLEEGLSQVASVSSLGSSYRVNAQQLLWLLRDAGFVDVQVTAHTFVDDVAGADDLFAWSSNGSFGNVLADLGQHERFRVRERLTRKLEALRAPDHRIRLERYLVFATARRR
jgi:arsenite methyltransferase